MVSTQQAYRDLELEGKMSQIHSQSIIFSLVIFSVLVFFPMCFIYTMCPCTHPWQNAIMDMDQRQRQRMGHAATNQNQASSAAQMSLFMAEIGPFSGPEPGHGLDLAAINRLSIVSYGTAANIFKEVDCSICLSNFQYGEKVKSVPQCCHAFHSECLDKWLLAQSNCPLCRAQVYSAHSALLIS